MLLYQKNMSLSVLFVFFLFEIRPLTPSWVAFVKRLPRVGTWRLWTAQPQNNQPRALHRRMMSPQQNYLNMEAERKMSAWSQICGVRLAGRFTRQLRFHRYNTGPRRVAWFVHGDVG